MSVTMQDVLHYLDSEEPDYQQAASLGPEVLVHLEDLARRGEPLLASKATYLASLIQSGDSVAVVEQAARRDEPQVRVAAAAALKNLASQADTLAGADPTVGLLERLLHDTDAGVRKFAARSAATLNPAMVRDSVEAAAASDPAPFVRQAARSALADM